MMRIMKLSNGMTIAFERRKTASVAVGIHVKVGSVNEGKNQAGITHLLEHMLFEGTTTRAAHDISNAIESVGGEFNAATSHERTFYYIHIPREYFSRALDILADIIKHPLFDEKTLKKEKKVVLNEMKVTNDDPKSYLWILFLKTLFKKHKAKNPIYGNPAAIQRMTQSQLMDYYTTHYIPKNTIISIVGNVNNPLPLIKKKFGSLTPASGKEGNTPAEPPPSSPRLKKVKRDVEHSYIAVGYQAPPRSQRDSYALDVIRSILGRGQSSRLFEEIRIKRGIAYMVGAVYESSLTFSAFAVYLSTTKKNVPEARKVLHDAFKLRNLTRREVEDAKNYLVGNFILENENNKECAEQNAFWLLLRKKPQEYVKNIREVTLEDVRSAAKKYFHKNYTEVIIQK